MWKCSAKHQNSGCVVHGSTGKVACFNHIILTVPIISAMIGYKLGTAVWKMGLYMKCAKYIACG